MNKQALHLLSIAAVCGTVGWWLIGWIGAIIGVIIPTGLVATLIWYLTTHLPK